LPSSKNHSSSTAPPTSTITTATTTPRFKKDSASFALSPKLATPSSASNARSSPSFEETSRLKKVFVITDQYSKIFGYRVLNSQLSFYLGFCQLLVCVWALSQHIYSLAIHKEVLYCNFNENITDSKFMVGVDAIIFDVGLFHSLWGIQGCVAQHLDGGYGRFGWCIAHIFAFCFSLPFAFCSHPKPRLLWPLLIMQSIYGIGLLILSLAALPRVLPTFMGDIGNAPIGAILVYVFGAAMNYMLLYWYWHWYWFIESEYESATKLRHNRLTDEVHSDPRRRPFHYPSEQLFHSNGFTPQSQRMLLGTSPLGTATTVQMIPNGTNTNMTKQVPYPNRYLQNQSNGIARRDYQQPPPLNFNGGGGYIPSENGYYGPMVASPMSQQSQRESLISNVSNLHFSKMQQQPQKPLPQRLSKSIYDSTIPSDLLSPQGYSDDYPSDDSATAPILSHSSPHYSPLTSSSLSKYRPTNFNNALKSSSSVTSSPGTGGGIGYATMAQARYAKFNSQPVSFRKTSITPGGAPFVGNRIASSQQIFLQSQSQGCSISSPSRNSRNGTPIVGPMYSTAI
jgi:hypothetical protein